MKWFSVYKDEDITECHKTILECVDYFAALVAAADALADAVDAEIAARQTYKQVLAVGGQRGPKGKALGDWLGARESVIAALAAYRAAKGGGNE